MRNPDYPNTPYYIISDTERCEAIIKADPKALRKWQQEDHRCVMKAKLSRDGRQVCQRCGDKPNLQYYETIRDWLYLR
jgi:hypothetical protein